MNQEQVLSLLRTILQIVGAIGGTLGWFAPETLNTLTASILAAAGPVMTIGVTVWSMFAHTKSAQIANVSKMSEVSTPQLVTAIKDPQLKEVAANAVTK